jgi:hypothetical protein
LSTSWRCPFCQHNATIRDEDIFHIQQRTDLSKKYGPLVVTTAMVLCPNPGCNEMTFNAAIFKAKNPTFTAAYTEYLAVGTRLFFWKLVPASRARVFPDYVPAPILADYREACSIETLSAKASATLARRCLQGIIRNFYGVTKSRLIDEIAAIEHKVEPKVFQAINALREMGNIGAHPENDVNLIIDVEPQEAAALIELVELLIDETYIADHERQKRLDAITKMAADKKALKSAAKPAALPPGGGTKP